jgi:hypothetical protein
MKIFHYCPNAAFLSIISSREVWLSELSLSNDSLEGRWIKGIVSKYCETKKVSPITKNKLLSNLDFLISSVGGAGFCMSEQGDLLSQWRAYADNGGGVAVGFSREYLQQLCQHVMRNQEASFGLVLRQVEYDEINQQKQISEDLDAIMNLIERGALEAQGQIEKKKEEKTDLSMQLALTTMKFLPHCYSTKNPGFAEEREWRIISWIVKGQPPIKSQLIEMEFRAAADRIIPFNRVVLESLDRSAIEEVVAGPRNITPEEVLSAALEKYGWNNVTVRRSTASYR